MISGQFECKQPAPTPSSDITIGVDLGVTTLVTAYDGAVFDEIAAPNTPAEGAEKIAASAA